MLSFKVSAYELTAVDIVVIGGGAAGFMAAIVCAESASGPRVVILEKATKVLAKVAISGGGRCNITNACLDPKSLVLGLPRGAKEMLGPFNRFGPKDTMDWFAGRGVAVKTESDSRVFPVTDRSESVIKALVDSAKQAGVVIKTGIDVVDIAREAAGGFLVSIDKGESVRCRSVLLATGSASQGYVWSERLGHKLVSPVPSLFTFKVLDERLQGISGSVAKAATVSLVGTRYVERGPVLVTHWGLSGPAVLKLSAWAARDLYLCGYRAQLKVDWVGVAAKAASAAFDDFKLKNSRKSVVTDNPFDLPARLWKSLAAACGISGTQRWAESTAAQRDKLIGELTCGVYAISAKGVFKEEFVTCGGVSLAGVDFRTMQSRVCPGLYLAGEILDIDGITGGYNLQTAWTTGWVAGRSMGAAAGLDP